ncbi:MULTISPECIES: hypothetical protein [unclassified Pseudomonas]|uniref:hypothetical protein n=1 Tax=unclassified Pseudomonas TaxID=196821 RepID=UPI00128EB3C2|nr:hypothetical protein [Pseudomonas sp. MN1F]MQG93052.1 hypothetical protein [Pseudomonas sp. MN1F]
MVGIAAVSISNTSAQAASTLQASDSEKTVAGSSPLQVDTSKVRGDDKQAQAAGGAQGSSESSEPAHIKQLREMIKNLQKQMAEEQKQLASLMAQNSADTTKLAAITAKQASIATLSGQIMTATAQLLEALQEAGGSSAGSVVDTQA